MNKYFIIGALLVAAFTQSSIVNAKPSGPISVKYETPKNVVIGETLATTVTFKSTIDLQQFVVSFIARKGLTVEQETQKITFSNINAGEEKEVELIVTLNDSKGYVTLSTQGTEGNGKVHHKHKVIKYGSGNTVKTKSVAITENNGEQLILMSAEVQ